MSEAGYFLAGAVIGFWVAAIMLCGLIALISYFERKRGTQ